MLCEQFAKRDDVAAIIGLDVEEKPALLTDTPKLIWIQANTSSNDWQEAAAEHAPTIIIHAAWQIRELYGRQHVEWQWNVGGARNVFEFALRQPSVERLIHFSTAAVYGAYKTNTIEHRFKEYEPMREEEYAYACEKIAAEKILKEMYQSEGGKTPQVSVVRPAAITGPRGRHMRIRFGLQSALSGQLKGNIFYSIISAMVSYVPATPWWVRQFIHEDDVVDIIALLAFDEHVDHTYEVFNITPPGDPVLAPQVARTVGKKVLPIYPWMVRLAFFVFWHISRGKIPNGRGVWRFYSYPVVLDGDKLTEKYGYDYQHSSIDAFQYTDGRYERHVPEEARRHKSS